MEEVVSLLVNLKQTERKWLTHIKAKTSGPLTFVPARFQVTVADPSKPYLKKNSSSSKTLTLTLG